MGTVYEWVSRGIEGDCVERPLSERDMVELVAECRTSGFLAVEPDRDCDPADTGTVSPMRRIDFPAVSYKLTPAEFDVFYAMLLAAPGDPPSQMGSIVLGPPGP